MKKDLDVLFYKELVSPFNQSKVLLHKDKLYELQKQDIVVPVCCEIDLTDGFCNNKCRHCFFSTNTKNTPIIMQLDRLKSVLEELKALGVKAIEFSGGGEPTTHPDIVDIINYTYNLGFDIGIVTNGNLLNKLYSVLDKFSFIRISLDSASPDTYEKVHGVNTFDIVINNIRGAVDLIGGNKIGIGYLIVPHNKEDIISCVKLARNLGCRFIQYRPASLEKSVDNSYWHSAYEEVKKAESYATSNFQVFNAGIKWGHLSQERNYHKCSTSSLVAVIKANGDVPLCVLKRNEKENILGNIYQNSFKDIYFSHKHLDIIHNNDLSKCRKPCKHDSYNIMFESLKSHLLHENFI